MNRYGRTGLRVLGGLLALMLAATLLPAAVYAAGGAYQVDEDSVYMNMEDSRPAALAAQVSRAPADNVTMQLFNYTGGHQRTGTAGVLSQLGRLGGRRRQRKRSAAQHVPHAGGQQVALRHRHPRQ